MTGAAVKRPVRLGTTAGWCLHDLIEQQAAMRPDATALIHEGRTIAYVDLEERAERLAGGLRAYGVGRGQVVGVCLDRGIDLVVAVLAVLKAGGAYTMLDPEFPLPRLVEVIRQAGATLVLTDGPTLPGVDNRRLAEFQRAGRSRIDGTPQSGTDVACVMFTSGSTGRPKGIVTSHTAIVDTLVGQRYLDNGSEHVWLQCSPVSWDAFALELFGALLAGATCVLQSGGAPEPARIAELVTAHAVTTMYASASLLNFLLDEHPAMFGGALRQLMTGGEAASLTHLRRMRAAYPRVRIINGYSPAENTIFTCCHTVTDNDLAIGSVPVGRAIAHKSVRVLDERLRPVLPGITGELYMTGSGLAYGYLGAAGASAERFVADPYGEPGDRMYRTGDLVRERPDGVLDLLGRSDDQIKIRGFRVEPAEIQAVLTEHPGVRQAAVVAQGQGADRRLIGYVAGDVETAGLRAYASQLLPAHLVPAAFVRMHALPLSPTGKLDRAALPSPTREVGRAAADLEERLLCDLFAEVLGLDEVGPEEDFFALGGHSLLAAKMVGRLHQRTGLRLTFRKVFDNPTAAGLAVHLRDAGRDSAPATIGRRTGDGPAPLSPAQARLWIADRLDPDTAEYVIPVALRIRGPLNPAALASVLDTVVRRHEPLRTRIVEVGGEPVQVVDPATPRPLPISDIPPDGLDRFVAEQGETPIDPATGPVFRAALGRLSADEHVLVICVHHIVADDWSVALLADELAGDALPEPPVRYTDVAAWQHAQNRNTDLAYWRDRLAGMPTTLELPADRPRPARRDVRGDRREFTVPADVAERLRQYGRERGASLYMVLLAAFQVLLSRYTKMDDFAIGTPAAGRTHPDTERLIGFFVNTLVLRANTAGEPDFAELLGRVRETVLDALHHQDLPFDRVVEELAPDRDQSRNPLVQVVFALQTAAARDWRLPGLDVERLPASTRTSKFDLFVALVETADGGLAGSLEYPAALFEAATMDRLAGHYRTLLEEVTDRPGTPVGRLPMTPPAEVEWLAAVLGGGKQPDLGATTVPDLVAEQVRRRPGAIAVDDGRRRLTYAELDKESARLAHLLRTAGAGPDVAVALCLERGADVVVALLGILRAGSYYVPLDADYPADRIAHMLEDSRAQLLIAERGRFSPPPGTRLLVWEDLGPELAAQLDTDPGAGVDADDLAYVMYTSGSTGRPKGVQVTHRGIVRLVHRNGYADFNPDQVFLLLAPLSFDASTFEVWGALGNGARLAVYPPGLPTADGLHDAIERFGVTVMWLTAGLFQSVVEARPGALDRLRTLVAGGDVLSPPHVRDLVERAGVRVSDGYGPTEATTFTCVNRNIRPEPGDQPIPIGQPIANTRVHVVDEYLAPVPAGVPGELMIAGPGLARGYRNRPALTADRFVANPFASGERMYRTGDVVRVRHDGLIQFLGRNDHQFKIRGFRVEPGEVEARLRAHPAVDQAVVIAREDTPGDRRLVAYVVRRPGADGPELREFCAAELPPYLVPAAVVQLDAYPLDPNGKLKRSALPAPRWSDTAAERVAPRSPTETIVAGIFAELLRVDAVGVLDDFFALGGHSLLAMKVVVALRRRFGVDLGVRAVFRTRTVARLAAEVDAAAHADLEPIPAHDSPEAPLAPAQAGLWFADRLNPGSREYLISRALRISGPFDPARLADALTTVIERHDVLRSRVIVRDGVPVQVADPATRYHLPVTDIAGRKAFLAAGVVEPLNLAEGPVFRATVGRIGPAEHVLLICAHHVFVDGWSLKLLADEIARAYAGDALGEPPPRRFGEVAAWQAGRSGDDVDWWRAQLNGMPQVVELPTDRPRPVVRELDGALSSFTVPAATGAALAELSRSRGATAFMTLLAAFHVLVHRATGLTDFAIGTPAAGRNRPETERLVGQFVNTVVLRADLTGRPAFAQLLDQVRDTVLGAFEHQDVPFDRIVEELQPQRELSRNPLVQLVFALETGDGEVWRLPGTEVEPLPVHSGTSKFDLYLALREHPDGSLTGVFEYSTALFDASTVERFGELYTALLEDIAHSPETTVDRLALVSAAERERLLHGVNPAPVPFSDGRCLHELIEDQTARSPGAVAVECGPDRLTYRELDDRAGHLATRLRALGVGPDIPVGVRMDRSAELIVGLLAVLKAGGAYVPIETEAPDARALTVLGDCRAEVCLVDQGAAVPSSDDITFVPVHRERVPGPARPGPAVSPDNLVSIYYTSGSTGRPKGVASTHRGWVNRMEWMQRTYRLRLGEAVLQKTTLIFDDAAIECFWPLIAGGRVVLLEPGLHREPTAIRDAAIRHRVAVLQFVPSMLTLFLDSLDASHMAGLDALRVIVTSGEALTTELLRTFFTKLGTDGPTLHNQWGATEVSIDSTMHTCVPADTGGVGSVSLGDPIDNNRVYVLDAHLQPVPVGLPGDLYLAGVGLARGYAGDPAKTAGAFVPEPHTEPGERMYRTGDRGYRRPDGTVVFLGRQDDQVKIRGIRVEPGEVEQVIAELPGVREAAVTVWTAGPGDKRLAGYAVPVADVRLTVAGLRDDLRRRLPGYLVPSSLQILTELPTTASGKVDRKALPAPTAASRSGDDYVAPDGPVAQLIADIWASVLSVARVGALDGFFDLGGHSLLAIRAMARMRADLDLDLPLSLLFQQPTLQDLAREIEQILLADIDRTDGTDVLS